MSVNVKEMPKLGFGLMRLPVKDDEIDMQELCRMVDAYMDAGFNYFDTAYVYHGGKSEVAAREAIVKRYPRESFKLATKLPAWMMKEDGDRDKIFAEQLERAGVDYFDFYLLHSLELEHLPTYEKYDCFNWGKQMKAEGKIKHFGFSYHGTPELLIEILDKHPEIEFVQIQLNYADWKNPVVRSEEVYNILAERNIPVIVMEPVKGGTLASLKPELEDMFRKIRPEASMASWALRYCASLPGVVTTLSGMTHDDQMQDNLNTFSNFEPLTDEESRTVAEVSRIMLDIPQIGCTACKYCTDGCPMNISIPDVFRAVNNIRLYGDSGRPHSFYNTVVMTHGRASECIGCGQCEGVCPQHLPIIDLLKEAAEILDK